MKRLVSIIIITTLLSLNVGVSAQNISSSDTAGFITNNEGFISEDWSKVNYISVDEYLKKYGGESVVNAAFNKAEMKNEVMLLKAAGKEQQATSLLNEKAGIINKKNDLLLSLKEGKFLGLEIESISDLPPDNINLSLRLKKQNEQPTTIDTSVDIPNGNKATRANNVFQGNHYDGSVYKMYYSSQYPNANDIYEPQSGSYFYKYGYSWTGDYRCTADLTFQNTQLYCGNQSVNMYAFIGATTDGQAVGGVHSIDFGFMANPNANERNKGLYAVRNIKGQPLDVEPYPKVLLNENSSTNPMILENKTVKLQLTIDTLGNVETVIYHNGTMIYYKTDLITGFVSGSGHSLTFFEAMSCVDVNGTYTNPSSGSFFKNVNFSNTKLYSYSAGERAFGTYGNNTYSVYICKPEDISYSYGTNSETVSIVYN